jgi:hypothetical protein
VTVLYLLALIIIGGVVWFTLHALPLFLLGGLDWDDLRSVLLHHAYRSFTFEGDVIPGVRPSLGTRLVIRALSPEDEARRALVTKAMGATEQRRRPRSGRVRLLLRLSARLGQSSGMSRALVQARWFTAPPLGAQFRA